MATPPEGFEVEMTHDDVAKMVEGFLESGVLLIHDGMVFTLPAHYARKSRIESLERKAENKQLPKEERLKAWDEAGRLKAQEKDGKVQ